MPAMLKLLYDITKYWDRPNDLTREQGVNIHKPFTASLEFSTSSP